MSTNDQPTGLERELTSALDDLHAALQRATDATATIKGLVPRLAATDSLFDEIEALVRAGRQHIGPVGDAPSQPQSTFTRPTLVAPSPAAPRTAPVLQPSASFSTPVAAEPENWSPVLEQAPEPEPEQPVEPAEQPDTGAELLCFRLEFESQPGPLDLRMVDDAVSEHPAVRDVALLDYDGRRATLKVWITPAATPADVQDSLKERAAELFSPDQDVTIVALEDAA